MQQPSCNNIVVEERPYSYTASGFTLHGQKISTYDELHRMFTSGKGATVGWMDLHCHRWNVQLRDKSKLKAPEMRMEVIRQLVNGSFDQAPPGSTYQPAAVTGSLQLHLSDGFRTDTAEEMVRRFMEQGAAPSRDWMQAQCKAYGIQYPASATDYGMQRIILKGLVTGAFHSLPAGIAAVKARLESEYNRMLVCAKEQLFAANEGSLEEQARAVPDVFLQRHVVSKAPKTVVVLRGLAPGERLRVQQHVERLNLVVSTVGDVRSACLLVGRDGEAVQRRAEAVLKEQQKVAEKEQKDVEKQRKALEKMQKAVEKQQQALERQQKVLEKEAAKEEERRRKAAAELPGPGGKRGRAGAEAGEGGKGGAQGGGVKKVKREDAVPQTAGRGAAKRGVGALGMPYAPLSHPGGLYGAASTAWQPKQEVKASKQTARKSGVQLEEIELAAEGMRQWGGGAVPAAKPLKQEHPQQAGVKREAGAPARTKQTARKSGGLLEERPLAAGGAASRPTNGSSVIGVWEVSCPQVLEEYGREHYDDEYSMSFSNRGGTIYGEFRLGIIEGVMQLNAKGESFGQASFTWRGRETAQSEIQNGDGLRGILKMLKGGRMRGSLDGAYGNFKFTAEKVCDMPNGVMMNWEDFSAAQYERERVGRWGGW